MRQLERKTIIVEWINIWYWSDIKILMIEDKEEVRERVTWKIDVWSSFGFLKWSSEAKANANKRQIDPFELPHVRRIASFHDKWSREHFFITTANKIQMRNLFISSLNQFIRWEGHKSYLMIKYNKWLTTKIFFLCSREKKLMFICLVFTCKTHFTYEKDSFNWISNINFDHFADCLRKIIETCLVCRVLCWIYHRCQKNQNRIGNE